MIGKLKGIVDSVEDDNALIDVGGVGYQVYASARTLQQLSPGEAAQLFIETHVREDHIHLYGFASAAERTACRLLLTVQGVGMKMALAILNIHSPASLAQAIAVKDRAALTAASGVGPKLAERILLDLKDKAIQLMAAGDVASFVAPAPATKAKSSKKSTPTPVSAAPTNAVLEEVTSALVNLGYGRSEAFAAVSSAVRDLPDANFQSLIPASLQRLTKSA